MVLVMLIMMIDSWQCWKSRRGVVLVEKFLFGGPDFGKHPHQN